MEATAMYNFDASQDDELSFRQGEHVKVLNMEDRNWFHAECCGRKGFIPSTYVNLETHDWYKGKMSRQEAEKFLMKKNERTGAFCYPDGAFIVRDCESDRSQFSLSVKHGGSPQHFKILCNPEGKYYLWPRTTFDSINQLIYHHRTNTVARDSSIEIILKDLVEQRSQETLYEAQYDFSPQETEEVGFKKGDIICLLAKDDENWWTGKVLSTNKQGLFPKNYVKPRN